MKAAISAVIIWAFVLATQGAGDRATDAFVEQLRRATARDDRAAVAALIQYPITVLVEGLRVQIRDAAAMAEQYDIVFTPLLKGAIARGAVVQVAGGFTINSNVTVQSTGGALKITSLMVPRDPGPAAEPSQTPDKPARSPAAARRQPRRILFRAGQPAVELAGVLSPGAIESYIMWAAKNRLLDVRINGVRARDVVARVLDAKAGVPLDARARDGARVWTGRLPATADYRIDVVRTAGASGGDDLLPYRIVVTLR